MGGARDEDAEKFMLEKKTLTLSEKWTSVVPLKWPKRLGQKFVETQLPEWLPTTNHAIFHVGVLLHKPRIGAALSVGTAATTFQFVLLQGLRVIGMEQVGTSRLCAEKQVLTPQSRTPTPTPTLLPLVSSIMLYINTWMGLFSM